MSRKNLISFILFFISILFAFNLSHAQTQESITITTYYPSPYGSYNELYVASKLGIGTTTPGGRLTIATNVGSVADENILELREGANPTYGWYWTLDDLVDGDLKLWRRNPSASEVINFARGTGYVTFTGNVGIGTTSPGAKLDVGGGDIRLSSYGTFLSLPEIGSTSLAAGIGTMNGVMSDGVPWYGAWAREAGSWTSPYPDYVLNNHTGIHLAAHGGYGGIGFYEQYNWNTGVWSTSGTELARFRHNNYGGSYFLTNLGIGTSSPQQALDVVGYIRSQNPYFLASSTDCWRAASGWARVVHTTILGGNSGGWYNTSTGNFTAPVTGLYLFIASHYVYSYASGAAYIHHVIGVNGNWNGSGRTGAYGGYTIFGQSIGQYDSSTSQTALIYLSAGETVQDNVYVSSSANYMCGYHSFFQGVLLQAL